MCTSEEEPGLWSLLEIKKKPKQTPLTKPVSRAVL